MPFFQFFKDNARWLAGGFFLCYFSSFGQTFFIALSAGDIRAEYGLSHGQFGSIYMAATLLSALTLPQIGRLVDHVSVARLVALVLPVLALATISMAFASTLVWLFLTIYVLRLFGQGMMIHMAMTAMGRWYSAQRGRAVATANLGNQAGEAMLPFTFVMIVTAVGWRNTWLMAAALLVIVALPLLFLLLRVERTPRSTDGVALRTASRDWTRGEVLRDPVFWMSLLGVLAPGFIVTTIYFHQVYLVELRNWPLEVFVGSFFIMSGTTVVASFISGSLIDRFSATRILPVFLLPLASACFVLGIFDALWSAFVFMFLIGISNGFSSTLFGALWPEIYGTKHLGGIRSIMVAILVLATALGPGLTGFLIDAGVPYPYQILAMGAYCLVMIFVMLEVRRRVLARNSFG